MVGMSETPKWPLDDAKDRIRAAARQQLGLPPVEPCEPRPRVVPVEGPSEIGAPTPLGEPASGIPGLVFLPLGEPRVVVDAQQVVHDGNVFHRAVNPRLLIAEGEHVWSRGFDYDSLGEGHYTDDDI